MMRRKKEYIPTFGAAALILGFLLVAMISGVLWLSIPVHMILIFALIFAIGVLTYEGFTWDQMSDGILYGGKLAIVPAMILMVIGMVIGSWIASGTVPMLIYWGLKLISPTMFLVTGCLVCAVTSLATGSSWSTAATVGVALIGVGAGLGVEPGMTAGAIVSGAYFGDKMSPLSDTTNMAPGIAEADLFDHIKSMIYTTFPGILITLAVYLVLGMKSFEGGAVETSTIETTLNAISTNFNMNILLLIPPVVVLACAAKKLPALPTLICSALIASLLAIFFQGETITTVTKIMDSGYTASTGVESIDKLLSRGGLQNMMWTTSMAIIVMVFGGILERSRMLEAFLLKIRALLKTTGALISTTVGALIILNFVTASQYLSIVIGGRMFVPAYKEKNFKPQVLSRTLEDAGTLFSPLVPWGLCGVFMAGTLGVPTLTYAPYAVLCWVVPIIAVIYGFTGLFVWKNDEEITTETQEVTVS